MQSEKKSIGRPLAITSIVIACMGIFPLIIFLLSCFTIAAEMGGIGFPSFVFFFLGFIIHGIGAILGFVAAFMRARTLGIIGIAGNVAIVIFAILSLFVGLGGV